jgi:outer membrane protein, heavy metal efflux system
MNIQRRIRWIFTLLVCAAPLAWPQEPPATPAKLADLIAEAQRNNPRIAAARQAWRAATYVSSQVSTLPDPQVMVQHVTVGSPRPFAGFSNQMMADFGVGFSQELPYPGKLKLRGAIAESEADVARERIDSVRVAVVGDLKAAYFRIGYVTQAIAILERDADLLKQVGQAAEIRYRSGMDSQQAVLQAQLESTKLLREITKRQLEKGQLEAKLKQLLNRPQSSGDIEAEPLAERQLANTYDELLTAAKAQNPDLRGAEEMIARQKLQVDLAHKDFYPDFSLQYMYLHTSDAFPERYMWSFGVRVPIYRNRRQRQELAQAEAGVNQSHDEYKAQAQLTAAELRDQYVVAQKTAELLKIYREGLVPQARAEFQAALVAYQTNREDFQALLASFEDVLRLDEEYWQNVAEHETALARLEQITGLELR